MADEIIAPVIESQTPETEVSSETPVQVAPVQTTEQVKAEIKKLNKLMLKVDGEEFEETLPFDIDDKPEIVEYLKKQLQLSKVSQKRMAQTSSLEKEIGAFLAELRDNPEGVLADPNVGVDLDALIKRHIEAKIEQSKKTPEQLAQEELQKELAKYKKELGDKEEQLKQRDRVVLEEKLFTEYNTSIESALKEANLPINPYMKGKIADYMQHGIKIGKDVKPNDVMELVKADIKKELTQMFDVMPTEVMEQLVGKDALKKFAKKAPVNKIVTPASATSVKDTGGKKEDSEKKKEVGSLNKHPLFKGLGF